MIGKIFTHIRNMIKYGYISLIGDDSKNIPNAIVTYFGQAKNMALIFPYGHNASPPVTTTKTIVFNVMSHEDNQCAIPFSQKTRFKNLKEGEVVIGNELTQSFIKFEENGNITIEANGDINIKANKFNINASEVNLGEGGNKIARLGDQVTVNSDIGSITGSGDNTSI